MYQGTTTAFNSAIAGDSRTFRARMVCGNETITGFRSVKLTAQANKSADTISIGGTVSAYIEVSMDTPSTMLIGKEWRLDIGLMAAGELEWVPMGVFMPKAPKESDSITTFTAYDRMVSKLSGPYFTDITGYPADGKTILLEIAAKAGIDTANISELPDGVMVPARANTGGDGTGTTNPFDGYTHQEAVGYLAQMYGRFATFNRAGKLEFRWYTESGYSTDRAYAEPECAELTYKLGKITCNVNGTALTAGTGTTGITIENPVMTQAILDDVYEEIGGMEYLPANCSFFGDIRLDLGDIISVKKRDKTTVKIPVMSLTQEFDGGVTTTVKSSGKTAVEENLPKGPTATALDRVYTELFLVKSVVADKVSTDYLEANYATIKQLTAVDAKIDTLEAKTVTTDYLEAHYATIKQLNATNLKVGKVEGDFADFKEGDFETLRANVADIDTLMFGSATGKTISTEFANSVVSLVGTGTIKDAMIENLSVAKVLAGDISTNKFRIVSDSGNTLLSDNTMQFSDGTRVRVQLGKDAQDDYNMYIWDATGKLMFDALGLTADGIQRAIIRDDMVSDTANIDGKKIDLESLVTEINNGTSTIKGSKILIDGESQTLDILFNTLNTTVTDLGETVTSQGTQITAIQGNITSKVWQQDIDTAVDDLQEAMTDADSKNMSTIYSKIDQTVSEIRSEVSASYTSKDEFGEFQKEVSSSIKQTAEGLEVSISATQTGLQDQINTITKYFEFGTDGLVIATPGGKFKTVISDNRYSMMVDDTEGLWLTADGWSYIQQLTVTKAFELLGYMIDQDADGNVNCGYVGE